MAFAKGRAFVILNRMAESGNSEAKKILGNLNSMSQEDLDSKLSTLFGKGGASKEGDTAPKDEKGGKAPEGKEEAPKGTKEPKEGKVVANKDFDPNKEGVQSIFGTEEENAKSKDKQVFDTMEEVAKPKEMTSAKEGIKPVEVAPIQENKDFNKKGLFGGDNIGGGNKDYLGKRKFMTEPNTEVEREIRDVLDSSDNRDDKLSGIAALKEKYEGNKVNLAALDKLEQEIEQEDTDEGLQQQLTTEIEDEYTMFGNEPEEALEILKEKYANDDRRLAMLDKIAATATKPADAKGSASNPMTSATQGIKPVENAEVVAEKYNNSLVRKGSAFDGLDEMGEKPVKKIPETEIEGIPEYTFEEAFGKTEATPLSYYSKDFKGKNEQYFVLKDSKGNKFFVDTQGYDYSRYYAPVDATKGATPVEGGKTIEIKGYDPVKGGKYAETRKETDLIGDELELALMSGSPYLAVDNVAKKLGNFISDEGKEYLKKLERGWELENGSWVNANYKKRR